MRSSLITFVAATASIIIPALAVPLPSSGENSTPCEISLFKNAKDVLLTDCTAIQAKNMVFNEGSSNGQHAQHSASQTNPSCPSSQSGLQKQDSASNTKGSSRLGKGSVKISCFQGAEGIIATDSRFLMANGTITTHLKSGDRAGNGRSGR